MSDLFARIRPVVGDVLQRRTVAVMGSPAAGVLVEYLAACGVQRWQVLAGSLWMNTVVTDLRVRYGEGFDISVSAVDSTAEMGDADLALVVDDVALASRLPRTMLRLAIFTPTRNHPSYARLAFPGETFDLSTPLDLPSPLEDSIPNEFASNGWEWLTAAPLMALCARALLLRDSEYAMTTWEDAWARGVRAFAVGDVHTPTSAAWCTPADDAPSTTRYQTPVQRRGTLLIAGLGSLGSVAARQLAPWVERLVLVDADHVEVSNLVRQDYAHDQVGEAKAVALAASLSQLPDAEAAIDGEFAHALSAPEIIPVVDALTDDAQVAALMRRYGVTAALVTTGTHADFAIARAARAVGIPHVVGRCYARARFWEAILVDGSRAGAAKGPSYEQVRRAVTVGPTAAPTPEEVAAYGAVGELAGEPATAMETGWAALWLARLMTQMMTPVALREGWLLARLAADATCFVGGVVVEIGAEGAAYGVRVPGEVHAWSAAEID